MNLDNVNQSPNHPAVRAGAAVPAEVYAARQFGKLLRAERLARGFSRDEVLTAMGLHPVQHAYVLVGIESGDAQMEVSWARLIDRDLGIPVPHMMAQLGLMDAHHLEPEDLPLAGRSAPVAPSAAPAARPIRRRPGARWRFAVTGGLVAGTVLMAVAVALVVLGSTASTLMLAWFALLAGWACIAPALAHFTAWWIGRRRGQ